MADQELWWKNCIFLLESFKMYHTCIDFSDSIKIFIQTIFSYVFNKNILTLPSLEKHFETAEHII